MQCSYPTFNKIRYSFLQKLHQVNSSFLVFNNQDLFLYIISTKDKTIMKLVAKFCFDILAGLDRLNTQKYSSSRLGVKLWNEILCHVSGLSKKLFKRTIQQLLFKMGRDKTLKRKLKAETEMGIKH